MNVLVVHAHPDPDSFGAAVRDAVLRGLASAGHQVTLLDLEAENYQPCLTRHDYDRYDSQERPGATAHHDPVVADHIEALRNADAVIFTFPTFWSGLPAVLKGWIDRTLLPGVGFSVRPSGRLRGELRRVRHVIGVTTYGSPRSYRWFVGDGGRRTIRTVRANCGLRCRMRWLCLDSLDGRPDGDRTDFLSTVEQTMAGLS